MGKVRGDQVVVSFRLNRDASTGAGHEISTLGTLDFVRETTPYYHTAVLLYDQGKKQKPSIF